jgi:hypothetical protein
MKRLLLISCAAGLAASLVACTEKPQTATPRKTDQKVWQATDTAFAASNLKPGDKGAWEEQIRTRALTQNEYNKVK